jgi:HAD superfamily hydrolase (TIGR01509 family)
VSYRGIIFDFNGTLVRDSRFHDEAWRRMSKTLRGQVLTDSEMTESVHGWTNRAALEYLLGRTVADDEYSRLSGEKESIYLSLCGNDPEFVLSPGAEEFLDQLKEENVPVAIATSAGIGNVDFYKRRFDLGRWFRDDVVVFDDGSFPGKPEPDIYIRAARSISLDPSACVVIEDAASGVRAAERAGIGKIIAIGYNLCASSISMSIEDFTAIDPAMALDRITY